MSDGLDWIGLDIWLIMIRFWSSPFSFCVKAKIIKRGQNFKHKLYFTSYKGKDEKSNIVNFCKWTPVSHQITAGWGFSHSRVAPGWVVQYLLDSPRYISLSGCVVFVENHMITLLTSTLIHSGSPCEASLVGKRAMRKSKQKLDRRMWENENGWRKRLGLTWHKIPEQLHSIRPRRRSWQGCHPSLSHHPRTANQILNIAS